MGRGANTRERREETEEKAEKRMKQKSGYTDRLGMREGRSVKEEEKDGPGRDKERRGAHERARESEQFKEFERTR